MNDGIHALYMYRPTRTCTIRSTFGTSGLGLNRNVGHLLCVVHGAVRCAMNLPSSHTYAHTHIRIFSDANLHTCASEEMEGMHLCYRRYGLKFLLMEVDAETHLNT